MASLSILEQLFTAVREGDLNFLGNVLNRYPNYVSIHDPVSNETPLHKASLHGKADVITLLLQKRASINELDKYEYTPLHVAVQWGMVEAVKVLCEHGADINMTDKYGNTPLNYAAQREPVEVVKVLCEYGADINLANDSANTPLHFAAIYGKVDTVKVLCEYGADINMTNQFGNTPLHEAVLSGQVEAVKVLCEHGADINMTNKNGDTPLHAAARCVEVEAVKVLCKHGADTNITNKYGDTPMDRARKNENYRTIQVLTEYAALDDTTNKFNETPLHKASRHGRADVITLLLQKGTSMNYVNKYGNTPLHTAALCGQVEAVKVLCEHGADINMANEDGNTPLHIAVLLGEVEAVKVLCEHGANVNMTNKDKNTPLDYAAPWRQFEACEHEADIHSNKFGFSPSGFVPVESFEIVNVLTEHGAVDNMTSKESTYDIDIKTEDISDSEYVAKLKNNYEERLSTKEDEINQLNDAAMKLKLKENEIQVENDMLKRRIEQLRESSKKEILAKQIEINQLEDDVSVLKIKQNEVETENGRLKLRIEKLRDLSKNHLEHLETENAKLKSEIEQLRKSSKKHLEYLETENGKLNSETEQLRKSSKLEDTVDTDSSNVNVTSKILKYGSYYVSYEAQYCGKKCMAKKEDVKNIISKKLLKREGKFLLHLNHPCVVQHLAMFNDLNPPVLLMEKMSMSLTEFLTSKQSHHVKISILRDTARGLHYIHDKGIIHSDLNGDNILLTENITAKLADFGRANFCQQHMKYLPETLHHLPPEIFEPYSKANCSTKVDVFSFGCVIIHTFTQERPIPDLYKYVETSESGKYKKHSEVERRLVCIKKIKKDVNAIKFYNILLKCLQDNPDHRPTVATLLSLLDEQQETNFANFFKFVDDMHTKLLFESEKYETSFSLLLVKQLKSITTLNVSGCNITKQGADMMATVLLNTVSLTKLNLSNTMLNSTRVNKIICALKNISSLKVLNMNNNDIDNEVADSIAAVLCNNCLMEHINLSHNKLTYTGILNIANSLSENIKKIDISSNFIASDNVVDLAAALSKCPLLQELNISHNLLKLTGVLTIARFLRHHPTLKILNLSNNNVSFSSACEFIVDVILSVNKTLVNLNVCGRNIRPRYIEDYLSPPHGEDDTDNFTLQNLYLLKHSSLNITNTEANVIKVTETCPISSTDIISYYVDHLGGVFYNRYNNFAIVVPPGAVSQGDCVEIQATANYFGPYIIPEGFYPISSYYWVSANYEFKASVYFVISHYAKIGSLEDINKLHVLHKCARDPNAMNEGLITIPDGVYFDNEIGYCVLATDHFCTYCGAKSDKGIPEYLTACYYTYDESSSGHFIAEVALFPSNYNCKKLIKEQCNKRNTEIKRSVTFDVVDGEELHISSIDSSSVNNHEWKLMKTGKSNIIHLRDFEFWKIFYGLTKEEIREREESFDYPPRLCIECVHIDSSKPLYSSFKVSKKHNNVVVGEFLLIKQVTELVQAPLPAPLQHRTTPLKHRILSCKPLMRDLNKLVVPKVSAEWEDIAFELDYEISVVKQISGKHKEDPKKCCKELFKDWLETSNGVKPKIWQTLLDKLKEIEELHSIAEDIMEKLNQIDL